VPELKQEPFVVRGDIFEITAQGLKYRIGCLDSTSIDDVEKLMDGQKADMVFTDPPYGIAYTGKGQR
jgi:DNA modification methylase